MSFSSYIYHWLWFFICQYHLNFKVIWSFSFLCSSGLGYSTPQLFMIIWEKYFRRLFLEALSFVFSCTLKWGLNFDVKILFQVATHTTSVYISITNGLWILGSCCTIFHWFWFIWKRNNRFLLGKCLQIYMIFRFYVSNFYNLQLINNVVYFSNHYRIWCYNSLLSSFSLVKLSNILYILTQCDHFIIFLKVFLHL